MAKKKRKSSSKSYKSHSTSSLFNTRTPPSIPKCVRKCKNGYETYFMTKNNDINSTSKFIFTKNPISNTYHVLKLTPTSSEYIDMSTDLRISPQTRNLFSNLTTLSEAIEALETWLGYKLPNIR